MSNYYNTILIVDDNPAILTALKICLAGVFTRIVTLSSTDRLVATMSEEHVDVVLLDMNFSLGVNTGQDGLFWLRTLKKMHPDTPVVLMTAYADVQLAVKGLKNGAADFVTKPWDNDELVRTLRDAVEKSREVVTLDKLEQQHVHRVVEQCHGNMSKAAECSSYLSGATSVASPLVCTSCARHCATATSCSACLRTASCPASANCRRCSTRWAERLTN